MTVHRTCSFGAEKLAISNFEFRILFALNFATRFYTVSESGTKCIPKPNGYLHIATASIGCFGTSLANVWWNDCRCPAHTPSSNKRNAGRITTTTALTNCNASFELATNEALHWRRGKYCRRRSNCGNTVDGKTWKYRMTIGNAQGRRYGPVNIFFITLHAVELEHTKFIRCQRMNKYPKERILKHIHEKNHAKIE